MKKRRKTQTENEEAEASKEVSMEAKGGGGSMKNFHLDLDGPFDMDVFLDVHAPGYRFWPTDEELLVHYLHSKVGKKTVPNNRIKDLDIYLYSPQQLSEMHKILSEEAWYFFTPVQKKRTPNWNIAPKREAGNGLWKATKLGIPIAGNNGIVGYKNKLAFHEGKEKAGSWRMHEYTLEPLIPSKSDDRELEICALSKIFPEKRRKKQQEDEEMRFRALREGLPDAHKQPHSGQAPLPLPQQPLPSGVHNIDMSGGTPSSSGSVQNEGSPNWSIRDISERFDLYDKQGNVEF